MGLTVQDLQHALKDQNRESAAGELGKQPVLRDVARVSLEASSYSTESGLNERNAAILSIYMLPGANALEVSERVKETLKDLSRNFPEGLDYLFPFDITEYISQSIHEVYKTLFEALLLVIFVVFLSLQNWRAAMIPTI
jgi:multidrug efflux pump subunit AcrB